MEKQLVQIEGMVENVVFGNENTGFAVIELNTGEEILPVVGELYGVEEGEELAQERDGVEQRKAHVESLEKK